MKGTVIGNVISFNDARNEVEQQLPPEEFGRQVMSLNTLEEGW